MAELNTLAEPASALLLSAPATGQQPGGFSQLSKRFPAYESARETFYVFNPENPGPWLRQSQDPDGEQTVENDYDAFRASLLAREETVRVYTERKHGIKFVLKESYARIQDELRVLRLQLEDPLLAARAQSLLDKHPYARRALPEDFLPFIDQLADCSYFSRILLLDESNVNDLWVRQVKKAYNSDFISSAAVEPNGDLLFFKRELEEYICTDLVHEWAHRLAAKYADAEKAFRLAILLEQRQPGWYFPSSYALTDFGEHWAVYGERMLSRDPAVFADARDKSAARALVFMRALRKCLETEPFTKSSIHDVLLHRCLETESCSLSKAREFICGFAAGADKEAAEQARQLLRYLDGE